MKQPLFSEAYFKKIKDEVAQNYRHFIDDLRQDFEQGYTTDVVDLHFLDQFSDILQDEFLDSYSPLKGYWMSLIDNLIYLIQLHQELQAAGETLSVELQEVENELVSFWEESEMAEGFYHFLNNELSPLEASGELLPILENQIIAFYVLHLNHYEQEFEPAIVYQVFPALGDHGEKIYLGDDHLQVTFKKTPPTFPSLPLHFISRELKKISLENENQLNHFMIDDQAPFLMMDKFKLYLLPGYSIDEKTFSKFKNDIKEVMSILAAVAPHLFLTFKNFTHTLVLTEDAFFPCYSHLELSGYTSINPSLGDRLMLLDNLIRENALHFLNAIFSNENFSDETIKDCFISFGSLDLLDHLKSFNGFSSSEKEKIQERLQEEQLYLKSMQEKVLKLVKNKKLSHELVQVVNWIYKHRSLI